ncbi:MAG TPA: septal ring lytic transglycosylase RlpA family protein [Oscillatoriaceae cyanobacterium M7585_C2015_266]|nr:septal ring lytic transglycosylase RlpA family protein [Oscillatoriaceae cyanobacterium M7585_C2015_266]
MFNWGRSYSPSKWLSPLDNWFASNATFKAGETISCVQSASLLGNSANTTFGEQVDQDSGANKILRFLQNLLPKQRHSKSNTSESISVVVVRPEQHNQAKKGEAKLGYRKLLSFWQKSALLKPENAVTVSKKGEFQVWVKGYLIAEIPDRERARAIASNLESFFKQPDWQPSQLQPALVNGMPAIKAGERILLTIDEQLAAHKNRSRELLAIEWLNNLRIALGTTPLTLVEAQTQMYGLVETNHKIQGSASWYGPYFHGRLTATGETFNQNELTAAHPSLPFDTYLKVTNLKNGKQVIVRVNDRGPYVDDRILDLSREAARSLNSLEAGVVPIEAVLMKTTEKTPSILHQPLTRL